VKANPILSDSACITNMTTEYVFLFVLFKKSNRIHVQHVKG